MTTQTYHPLILKEATEKALILLPKEAEGFNDLVLNIAQGIHELNIEIERRHGLGDTNENH